MLVLHARELEQYGYTLWWWRERGSGELVGQIGLRQTTVEEEPAVEVGWSVAPRHWGRGFATEAARASIDYGFGLAGLEQIVSFALPHNAASRRVMEKAGLAYERGFEREGLPHVLYRVRREGGASPRRRRR